MPCDADYGKLARGFAEELRVVAPILNNPALVECFASVPRHLFVGEGPWQIIPARKAAAPYSTPNACIDWVYHNVLVVLDGDEGINNGQPSLWAYLLDQVSFNPGEHIFQVGAGTGYYTAILAELVGSTGKVTAVEYHPHLASRAAESLSAWPQVALHNGDGTVIDPGACDVIVLFAGMTHPLPLWLDRLNPGGRLLMPLTDDTGFGRFLEIERLETGYAARSLGVCGFINCIGARAPRMAERLTKVDWNTAADIRSLHRGAPPDAAEDIWLAGDDFWLSTSPAI